MINAFLNRYGDKYPKEVLEYIKTCIKNECINSDTLKQIYSSVGLINPKYDLYFQFLNKIKEKFGIDKNILEVGAGFYPALSEKIDKQQNLIGKGTITAYDPNLIVNNLGNINLNKEYFNSQTPLNNIDLIVAVWPCHATEDIIKISCNNNIDFSIVLCNCIHHIDDAYKNIRSWQEYIYEFGKNSISKDKILELDYIDNDGYIIDEKPYELVISSRKKH